MILKKPSLTRSAPFIIFIFLGSLLFAELEELKEQVRVLNIEIPVRVYQKGHFVENLKKKDFKLWVNGKPREINGFYLKRKKIEPENKTDEIKKSSKSRFFILVFSIMDYNKVYNQALSYFFNNILKENDKLMVFCGNKKFSFPGLKKKETIIKKISDTIQEQGRLLRIDFLSMIKEIERGISELKTNFAINAGRQRMGKYRGQFFTKYKAAWETFKRYNKLNVDSFYHFSRYLSKINLEKWVICFYQQQSFPVLEPKFLEKNLNLRGYLIIKDIYREQRNGFKIPSVRVSQLFNNVDTTFHTVIIPTLKKNLSTPELREKNISTFIRNNLRDISISTGGSIQFSNNLKNALKEISGKQDLVYVLTYAPKTKAKPGTIKIKVNKPGYKLVYNNNKEARHFLKYLKKKG